MRKEIYSKNWSIIIFLIITLAACNNKPSSMIQDSAKKEITKSKKLIKKYTIIFDLDYDNAYSIPNPIEFSANERIGNLPEGYRAGYDFGGWFTEKDGNGKELINFFPVTDNMVAYAKWNKKNQQEFNAYGYSQNIRNLFNERGYISDYAYYPLELSALVVFSKDELHLLREKLEEDLKRGFGPGILSEDHLTNAYSHNINILALVEEYFPNENELNSKLNGLRCFAYRIPDQGYRWGDYLKLYKNGIFEYISRDFQATRYRNKIYGGSKFGLWTIDTEKNKNYEDNIEIIIIPEINENVENLYSYYNYKVDKTILIFNNIWMKVSEDYNVELDWGYKY